MPRNVAQGRRTDATLVVTNVLWNAAASLFGSVIAFLLVPFLLGRLGESAYGIWALIGSVFAYSVVFQLGLVSAVNRYIPVRLASGDVDGLRAVVSTCAAFLCGVGVVLLVLTALLWGFLLEIFQVPPELADQARLCVLVVGVGSAFNTVLSAASAILSGYQRYDLMGGSRIAVTLARTALLVWLVVQGHGLIAIALVYAISELFVNALYLALALRLLPPHPFARVAIDAGLLREMLHYGFNTFNYILGALLLLKVGEVLIGIYRGPEEVAHYAIVTASVLTLSTVIEAFCAAIKPAASDLEATDDHARLKELTLLSQKYSLFMILPSAAFLLVMGREFLAIWTQKDIPLLPTILAIVVAGHAFRLAQHSSFFVLVGMGEHRFFGRLMLIMASGTVILGWASLALLDWGLVGVAWASAIPLVFGCGVLMPRHVYRQIGIGWSESLRRVWAPSLGGALPGILLLIAWKLTMPPRSWPELLLVVVAVAATTGLAAWRLGLGESERVRFWGLAKQGFARVFA